MTSEKELLPLSPYQRDIYFDALINPESAQYTVSVFKALPAGVGSKEVDREVQECLKSDLTSQIQIVQKDGVPYQVITGYNQIDIVHLDANHQSMVSVLESWTKDAFPLHEVPLISVAVVKNIEGHSLGLLVKAHHIVCDGKSLNMLVDKLFKCCLSSPNTSASLESMSQSYVDAVKQSNSEPVPLELIDMVKRYSPVLFSHSDDKTNEFTRERMILSKDDVYRIKDKGSTPYQVVVSALSILLSRIHNNDNIVIGVPFGNREGRESMPGQWANTLPLEITVNKEDILKQLMESVADSTNVLKGYQYVSLGNLISEMSSDNRQLFDVTLSYNHLNQEIETLTDNCAYAHDSDAVAIHMNTYGNYQEVVVDINLKRDIEETYQFSQTLQLLIDTILSNPKQQISKTCILSLEQNEKLNRFENGPQVPFSNSNSVSTLFEKKVQQHGDVVAIRGENPADELTFEGFYRKVNKFATVLKEYHVQPGDVVGIMMDRSSDMLATIFAVHKIGGVYLPLDPNYPEDRISYMVSDSQVNLVVSDKAYLGKLNLDNVLEISSAEPQLQLVEENDSKPGEMAYTIYTSGSTGQPKGVMVEHASVVNRIEWMQEKYPLNKTDVILQKTPISFDVSVWELFWWSITGSSLALLPPGAQKDPLLIVEAIEKHGVTTLHFVPSMLQPFLELLEENPELINKVRSLRRVFTSGEALPPARVNQFHEIFKALGNDAPIIVNLYGPTEATVDVTYFDFGRETSEPVQRVPIGFPINNTSIRIVSTHGSRQPLGYIGEIQIGGIGLARGYHNKEQLTRERFIFDEGVRWYKSGDLGRWLPDGSIEYLGRIDNQVKIRGNRIELGEIQNNLEEVPGIKHAEVLTEVNANGDNYLHAYFVSVQSEQCELADLRNILLNKLPEFMVPTRFSQVPYIPLTPNGKADRRTLQSLVPEQKMGTTASTPMERTIVAVWEKVLNTPVNSTSESFYAVGGDSILMLKVRSELEKLETNVTLADLSKYLTVSALAKFVESNELAQISIDLPPFKLIEEKEAAQLSQYEDAYPATQLQLGLIFHSQQDRNSATYKDVFRYSFKAKWSPQAFKESLSKVIERHSILRTVFDLKDFSQPLQLVKPSIDINSVLDISDLSMFSCTEAKSLIADYMQYRTRFDYDFETGPLYRIALFKLKNSLELVFSFHHAILDGGSVANLMKELFSFYRQDPKHIINDNLPSTVRFVYDEKQAINDKGNQAFWVSRLENVSAGKLIGQGGNTSVSEKQVFTQTKWVPETLNAELVALAKKEKVSLKSLFFAAHCFAMSAFSDQKEIVTGLVTHGRPEVAQSEQILGLFLNTLPVRFNPENCSWKECIDSVFASEQEHAPYRRYPLNEIQKFAGDSAKITTAFNFIHFHVLSDVFDTEDCQLLEFEPLEETNFELLLNVMTDFRTGQNQLRFDFKESVFSDAYAEAYTDVYLKTLAAMTENSDQLATLSQSLPNHTVSCDISSFSSVVSRIQDQVLTSPSSIAISFEEESVTYEELWRESGYVASALRCEKYPNDRPVGIALERSPKMVFALVGILRAGYGCLPLDLSYPKHRIDSMIEQAKPSVILMNAGSKFSLQSYGQSSVKSIEGILAQENAFQSEVLIEPEHLSYLLFTSGSTGNPKGVAMPHRSLSNLTSWQNNTLSGKGVTSTLQYAPLSFDVSFQEIFSTLTSGGKLVMISEVNRRDPSQLLRLIDSHGVERIYLPYVALQQLAETAVTLNEYPQSLRVVASSGEQLRVTPEIRQLISQLNDGVLENQYGPTETHVVTSFAMSGDTSNFPSLPPIGKNIDHTSVVVLDDNLLEVPNGVSGELYVRGKALADGYYQQEELTSERFVQRIENNERLYKTGDFGIQFKDGNIICLGRRDAQVKVRGYRVELAEIELAIASTPSTKNAIKDVAVVMQTNGENDHYLSAFIVGEGIDEISEQINSHLSKILPSYMIPNNIEWLEEFPKTASGKRDDAALRKIVPKQVFGEQDLIEPRDLVERTLCDIAADLLQIPTIAINQNLFELGGTSLTAMRLVVLVEKHFGVNISLSSFVSKPTIEQLAVHLSNNEAQPKFSPLVPMRTEGSKRPLFFVHPMGGNVLSYLRLVKHLPKDQPFYALQAFGVDAGAVPLKSVQEQARSYIESIRQIQPSGPYSIGGWSYGGFVSFEIARQLKEQGEVVKDLFVVDTVALNAESKGKANEDALLCWFFWELLWEKEGATLPAQFVPSHIKSLQDRFDYIADHAIATGAIPKGSSRAVVQRLFDVYRTNWKSATDYSTCTAGIDMTLLHASRPLPDVLRSMHDAIRSEYKDPKNGWDAKTTGKLNVIDVPGDHLEIMEEPYVKHVAKVIEEEMSLSEQKLQLQYDEEGVEV
ncbi:non-ribosomal peptide synthetase [Vibrio sp. vnigr-6D03]|uniref:amino acid adenylation domain-containing protein n=1 Tax=Vibrio sp. vnigr-6D03 TaxID=2058088 RepID=UPI0015E07F0A|nr:non-ribosomal peptide synthetase [Vibrio sp. vnigr-6D03]